MTHRSRLAGFIIDCQTEDLDAAAVFWAQALGITINQSYAEGDAQYVDYSGTPSDLHIEVQKVEHASRVHLDIESDDIEAEVERLEALGAKRLEKINTWWVMEAPTGHRFCVVRPQRNGAMPEDANEWN
jgi:predicted enzyme related to lactoylglutathione lyase